MSLAEAISSRSRLRKLELFQRELAPTPNDRVLDVGVDPLGWGDVPGEGQTNFFEHFYRWPHQITALGLHDGREFAQRYPSVAYVQGDALEMPFPTDSFDIVFSNAVVEHVGDWEAQQQFALEVRRVGKRYFVTTPNRWFPIETHTRLPFVHWLPAGSLRDALYRRAGFGWAPENFRLLRSRELQALFPDARILNLGMTLIAVGV
jgi:SAM-dependent methyltransferase